MAKNLFNCLRDALQFFFKIWPMSKIKYGHPCSQFHQQKKNILGAVFLPISWRQKITSQTIIRDKLREALWYEKFAHKM